MIRPIFIANEYYVIQNHGNARENIFKEEKDFHYFRHYLDVYMQDHWLLVGWCLIPDGFKLIVKIKENYNDKLTLKEKSLLISRRYAAFMINYARRINRIHNRRGSVFAKNFKRRFIETKQQLRNEILALHNKPCERQYVSNPNQWKYSSCAFTNTEPALQRLEIVKPFDTEENFIAEHCRKSDLTAA